MRTLASVNPHGTPLPGFLKALAGPIDHYGVGAIALLLLLENIGVPVIPGELAMITGAIFAGTGRAGLNVVEVGVVSVAAAIAGAEIGYLIGKFAGRELVLRYGRWVFLKPHYLDRAEAIVSRFGGIVVLIARFIVGLREANGIIAGLTQMRWLTFGWFNVLGACAWVATWVSIGYVAGDVIGVIYRDVNRFALYVLLALAVLLAGYVIRRVARRRRHRAVLVTTDISETSETVETLDTAERSVTAEAEEQTEVEEQTEAEEQPEVEEYTEAEERIEAEEYPEEDAGIRDDLGTEEDQKAGDDFVTRESP